MFRWLKKKKNDSTDKLIKAIIQREQAAENAIRKMNLISMDRRLTDKEVAFERRHKIA